MGTFTRFYFFVLLPVLMLCQRTAAQTVVSVGVHTGINIPITIDKGIQNDPRYHEKYELNWAPVGLSAGIDFDYFGVMVSPSLIRIGQDVYVVNSVGGQIGTRNIDMQYLSIPFAFKLHLMDLNFFKVSAIASLGPAFPIKAEESISHSNARMIFPQAVYGSLPSDYVVDFSGVDVPVVNDVTLIRKEDFNSMQIFAGLGLRSDWDITESFRISFDLQMNYGILEPRSDEYLTKVRSDEAIYDMYGSRRDLFLHLNVGVSRTVQIESKGSKFQRMKFKAPKRKPSGKG